MMHVNTAHQDLSWLLGRDCRRGSLVVDSAPRKDITRESTRAYTSLFTRSIGAKQLYDTSRRMLSKQVVVDEKLPTLVAASVTLTAVRVVRAYTIS